jgi:hypothetical protein
LEQAFAIILESYVLVDSVLSSDLAAKKGVPDNELYTVVERNGRTEYRYSDTYFERYGKMMNAMVERRMRDAVRDLARYWFTAWVNAGKPELPL